MNFRNSAPWRILRELKIIRTHARVARICQDLLRACREDATPLSVGAKKEFGDERIIWQYWAQGFENAPELVQECARSVDRYSAGWKVIRLSDRNLDEYLDLPDYVQRKRSCFQIAFFADLIRVLLLRAYGGIWADATILLSGPVPEEYTQAPFFVFRRDPKEPDFRYWRNTYAYYFGWAKGFRVNMLNSFIAAHKDSKTLELLCQAMLKWWKEHDSLPDYFFQQVLFDCMGTLEDYPLVSDTLPHYLQQSRNDPAFSLMDREDILRKIPIHKLTYK